MIKDRPRRLDLVFADAPVYFVTFCTRDHQEIPSLPEAFSEFERYSKRAHEQFNVAVGRYVIMPDHIHLFVCSRDFILSRWVGGLKRALSVRLKSSRLWQAGFFDHVLRSDESYSEKWQYVRDNPVRAGLVAEAEHWQFQGEIVLIDRA